MSRRSTLAGMGALALVVAGCGDAETEPAASAVTPMPVQTPAQRLAGTANASWINLEGTVASKTPGSFVLDYGGSSITVEMDDWDWYQEGRAIAVGDRVSVTGRVDRDLFEQAKLEASSVYVHNLRTYFYASGSDEEDVTSSTTYMVAPAGAVDATGYVTSIEGREFTVGTRTGSMRVDTAQMADNPLDQQGSPQVRIADHVYVWGRLDVDPRERSELMADGLVLLRADRTKRDGRAGATAAQGSASSPGNATAPSEESRR